MENLVIKLREFAKEREWDKYHSPKNLTMALSVEVAELVEHFQWKTEKESYELNPGTQEMVKEEIGDIFLYLIRLSDKLGIDLMGAAREKIEKNKLKYPVELSKGNAKKYKEFE
jgi:dCTP diphosphatase